MDLTSFQLDGRRAVVTGGVKGLGFAMACALGQAGAEVVVLDIDEDGFRSAHESGREQNVELTFIRCDVGDSDDVAQSARGLDDGMPLVLVNNAGIVGVSETTDLSAEEWQRVLDVNLWGVFLCAREFGKVMIKQGRGNIINVASVYGTLGSDAHLYRESDESELLDFAHYHASKGGVIALTRALACSWARHGIRVNAISPGMMMTTPYLGEVVVRRLAARTPLGRLGQPEDVAGAAVFLASDASSFVTGTNLIVDGGWSAW